MTSTGVYLFPLSYAQQRMWFLDKFVQDGAAYNITGAVRMRGALDLLALADALAAVARRHETLHTSFREVDGELMQVIDPSAELAVPLVDVSHLQGEAQDAEVQRLALAEARTPFDLQIAPLLRTTLLKLGAEEHVLLVTLHHIIADGWSMGVLIREMGAYYRALLHGEPDPLPELPIQYADYANWQKEYLTSGVLDQQLAYWQDKLQGPLPVLDLPTDFARPAVQTLKGTFREFFLDKELTDRLKEVSLQEGVSLFMTLLAAFNVLLHRYTGQNDLIVGTPIAGRTREELEGLIGLFLNTLAIRADLSGDPTFVDVLGRVRDSAFGAYAHQDVPFERLVEEVSQARDLSRTPLFQVMFILQNAPSAEADLPGVTMETVQVDTGTSKFDLTLYLTEKENGIYGTIEYSTDLFRTETAERMMRHFQNLLRAIAADPAAKIGTLPLLDAAERTQLLTGWNETAAPYREDGLIHELIAEQAARTPDATAVECAGAALTFRELNARANTMAHRLQEQGIGAEGIVGIRMERSLEMIIAMLGVLKAGGAYLPLDPTYPAERLAFMTEDAGVQVVLTRERVAEAAAVGTDIAPHCPAGPDNTAYVIFTSGSTGKPKGVMVQHSNVVNFFAGMDETIGCKAGDSIAAVTSIGFDISVLELFWTLANGCQVVLHTEADVLSANLQPGVTMLQCTPSLMGMMLANAAARPGLQGLQKILLGGEAMPAALAQTVKSELGARLFNMYGPTEATVWATVHEVQDATVPIPLGRPIANTGLYILDQQLQPVPVGVAGELHIGGAGVSRGYLGREELTAERFIRNPFGEGRLYKTGDLAAWNADGTVKYLGRLDHQVKLRGFRIELGEIETRLAQHPNVREAVVTAPDNRVLAAYIVSDGQAPTSGDLRLWLQDGLPEYMVPALYIFLDQLPLTPNGKVDRNALPLPEGDRPELSTAYVAPSTPLEKQIAGIWQEYLNVEKVGVNDNFFELGGQSILVVQIHSRLAELGHQLAVVQLFQYPTVRSLAQFITGSNEENVVDAGKNRADTRQAMRDRRQARSNRRK
ncbi:amino acid adenylation domain-containing protein [Tumebacillus sp. BK434]|uniref:non-ribosomal peptide synthetase n=1 Tax=Tumebacillus sp. BK434 TaxID=2512169 RepID=UPI00104D8B09|nr:non-ribosomal peptide synthetase [Tumebacillus sp. BK434]TCP54511.1 amino acid adenylation domain-containing protein [Tumebacillus sp. BK434]